MYTDIPLKRLTRLCAIDLLSLLGTPDATVLSVETLEMPANRTSLDTVLRLRNAEGQTYLHLVEWQGWRDPLFLWRTLGYLAWLGQNEEERPVLATIIYLTPNDDVGEMLTQALTGYPGWSVRLPCVRLWEQDALAAVSEGKPGLMALSPLMHGATVELVEHAAQQIIAQVTSPMQGELLATLGIFAEPLMEPERFIRLVTRERLMSTDLIAYLTQEKTAELEQKLAERELFVRQALQQAVEDVIITRFPDAPALLIRHMHQITVPERLMQIHTTALQATELTEVERLITAAVAESR
jgi:hypothetical protein